MGYSPWGRKESGTTEQLMLSNLESLVEGWGCLFRGTSSHTLCLSKCPCEQRPPAVGAQEAPGQTVAQRQPSCSGPPPCCLLKCSPVAF